MSWWKAFKYLVAFLAIIAIINAVTGTFNLFGTVVSTPKRVIEQTLQTDNVIQSYEWFFDVDAAYDARLAQVNQYQTFLNGEDDKAERYRIRIEMSAMQQTCRDLATKYNANSMKMNKSIFKGWDLPDTLSLPACK